MKQSIGTRTQQAELPFFEIRRSSAWRTLDLRELWKYRELVFFLIWRDIKVRYKQTVIGVAWAILQPAAMMIVFGLIFGRLAGLSSQETPYPLFTMSALLPWQLFSRAITESTNSLVSDQRLISRVYFPRIIVPTASVIAALVDFLLGCVFLLLLIVGYGTPLRIEIFWAPVFVALMLITALGVGFWLSALNLEYRDVSYTLPFLTQFWFFVTPVVYPTSLIPEQWRIWYALNPMSGVVDGFRWCFFGVGNGLTNTLPVSIAVALGLFVSGTIWFRRRERNFSDAIGSGGR